MKKTHSAMVRLTEEQYQDLERIAKKTSQDPAKLIRLAIEALFQHYERNGNRLLLPLDFSETVKVLRSGVEVETATSEKAQRA